MLPEFRLRPSLSAFQRIISVMRFARVAGVSAPAFVERLHQQPILDQWLLVLPEFRLRPSLSGGWRGWVCAESMRVAGVSAPAFVERARVTSTTSSKSVCCRSFGSGLR